MSDFRVALISIALLAAIPAISSDEKKCGPEDWAALVAQKQAVANQAKTLAKVEAQEAAMRLVMDMVSAPDATERDKLIDGLKAKLPVDDTFESSLLHKRLGDAGTAGKKTFDMMTSVQAEIGALTAPGKTEGTVTSLARRVPFIGRMVSRKVNATETTVEALDRIGGRLAEQRGEVRTTKNELRATVKEWERLVDTFEAKAARLEVMRDVLSEKMGDLPERSDERHALAEIIDVLSDRELVCRANVKNLLAALDNSVHVLTLLNQGERMLDTTANTQLVQLKIDMTTMNALGVGDKVQGTVSAVKKLADETRLALAQNIARVTDLNIATMTDSMKSPTDAETKRILGAARSRQDAFEAERIKMRDRRLKELKVETANMHLQLETDKRKNDRIEASLTSGNGELPQLPQLPPAKPSQGE